MRSSISCIWVYCSKCQNIVCLEKQNQPLLEVYCTICWEKSQSIFSQSQTNDIQHISNLNIFLSKSLLYISDFWTQKTVSKIASVLAFPSLNKLGSLNSRSLQRLFPPYSSLSLSLCCCCNPLSTCKSNEEQSTQWSCILEKAVNTSAGSSSVCCPSKDAAPWDHFRLLHGKPALASSLPWPSHGYFLCGLSLGQTASPFLLHRKQICMVAFASHRPKLHHAHY